MFEAYLQGGLVSHFIEKKMRALYYPELQSNQAKVVLDSKKNHHFINVLRMKKEQELLLLNGQGLSAISRITHIDSKSIECEVTEFRNHQRKYHLDLALGSIKKEALELALKQSVELGVRNIIIFQSQFSQEKKLKEDRLSSVLISSLEQSNNPFLPKIAFTSELDFNNYKKSFVMHFIKNSDLQNINSNDEYLLVVGPEGGFSQEEIENFKVKNCSFIHLPTPILRAQTAVTAGVATILSKLS